MRCHSSNCKSQDRHQCDATAQIANRRTGTNAMPSQIANRRTGTSPKKYAARGAHICRPLIQEVTELESSYGEVYSQLIERRTERIV
jgi:hypothetical protein